MIAASQQGASFCGKKKKKSFQGGSYGKESACSAGDPGSIPESGRYPGEGNGYPFQYSCLENSMDGGAWWATVKESDTTEQPTLTRSIFLVGRRKRQAEQAWENRWEEGKTIQKASEKRSESSCSPSKRPEHQILQEQDEFPSPGYLPNSDGARVWVMPLLAIESPCE